LLRAPLVQLILAALFVGSVRHASPVVKPRILPRDSGQLSPQRRKQVIAIFEQAGGSRCRADYCTSNSCTERSGAESGRAGPTRFVRSKPGAKEPDIT
jgi:hypothetical protein